MKTYTIFKDCVIFHERGKRNINMFNESMKIPKELVSLCAGEIERITPVPDNYMPMEETGETEKFSNMILCPICNNYGFPSTYTLADPGGYYNICTECANRMRDDGLHIVDYNMMVISSSVPTMQPKYSSNEIYQKVIQAEKEASDSSVDKRKWQLRACAAGICPKCGYKVKSYNSNANTLNGTGICSEYKCEACSFNTEKKNE